MKLRICRLGIVCRRSVEMIEFADFSYFHGEIGAGKSTIARLIDYCLGGELVMTPALQTEFVEVSLYLTVNDIECVLTRSRDANQVRATWGEEGDQSQIMIPARRAVGVVLEGTEVEVLSDLLFYLCGIRPPRVRRSQLKEESELERLSFRDLFWYCYLDQDTIDSSFFNLDHDAENFRRLKSRNVLRYVLGIHQERVAELEVQLEEKRERRLRADQAAVLLQQTLAEAELGSEMDLNARMQELRRKQSGTQQALTAARGGLETDRQHASDRMRQRAKALASELEAVEEAIRQVESTLADDQRHLHEIIALSTKLQRVTSARSILSEVEFERCPRCTQTLPQRSNEFCSVCGQPEPQPEPAADAVTATRSDLDTRIKELREMIAKQQIQRKNLGRRLALLVEQKQGVDRELDASFRAYDPALLANIVALEREAAGYQQEERYLEKLAAFPRRAEDLRQESDKLQAEEQRIRRDLREAREAAERDTANVRRLAQLFAECLVRAKLPGFTTRDKVTIDPPWYLPEVIPADSGEIATISFETLGSGGIKTLFKACFALAMHRLAVEIGANLPTLILIDSPMKNISERENREQFEGFHALLYELAENELRDTQFVLIDKEYCAPARPLARTLLSRHMKVNDPENPPLISYYRAEFRDEAASE